MPRKVDPHWGKDGFHDVEPFCLKPEQAEELTAILGIAPDPAQVANVCAAVEDIGTHYWNWRGRGPAAFTRAEARKALEDLLKIPRIDHAALTALNGRAFDCVYDALVMMKPSPITPGDTAYSALTEDRLDEETLRKAIRAAIDELKAQKGPERTGEIAWAVEWLCRHYEDLTGQKATHSNKGEHMGYEQSPRSLAGQFVQACFKFIDPQVTGAQVSRALRYFIEHRK